MSEDAVRVLPTALAGDAERLARFQHERSPGAALARLMNLPAPP